MLSYVAVFQYRDRLIWILTVYQTKIRIPNRKWQNVTGHVTLLVSSLWWSSSHFPSCWAHHIRAAQFKSNLVSVITTADYVMQCLFRMDTFPLCSKSWLTSSYVIGIQGFLQLQVARNNSVSTSICTRHK